MGVTRMAARRRSFVCSLICLALISACGNAARSSTAGGAGTPDAATASPAASPTTAASPATTAAASPSHLPGSVVRMSVNGVDHPMGSEVRDAGDGPIVIVLTFPFAVDRQSVDRWGLPRSATKTWTDDRTLRLVFPETETNLGFKIAQTQSASGDAIIDWFVVSVMFPATRVVSVFNAADLMTGGRVPQPASSWRVRSDDGITLSPDAKRVLIYDGLGPASGQVPTFTDLDTKKRTALAQPPTGDGPFAYVEWMANGRLVMVGRGIWVGDVDAGNMTRVANAESLVGGTVSVALTDPSGKRIAIWGHNSDGHIAVADLTTGAVQLLAGPFRPCVAGGRASFAWSTDSRLLAGTDCDTEEGPANARVRIIDVASDRTVRTIEGGTYGITGLATGDFMLVRDSGETGEGVQSLGLVMGFDGQVHDRYRGHAWQMSPDGRYLLQTQGGPAGGPTYMLFDLVTGLSVDFGVPCGGRNEGGCPPPHWMRGGRLAYY
jgi:hypothetical protein